MGGLQQQPWQFFLAPVVVYIHIYEDLLCLWWRVAVVMVRGCPSSLWWNMWRLTSVSSAVLLLFFFWGSRSLQKVPASDSQTVVFLKPDILTLSMTVTETRGVLVACWLVSREGSVKWLWSFGSSEAPQRRIRVARHAIIHQIQPNQEAPPLAGA